MVFRKIAIVILKLLTIELAPSMEVSRIYRPSGILIASFRNISLQKLPREDQWYTETLFYESLDFFPSTKCQQVKYHIV